MKQATSSPNSILSAARQIAERTGPMKENLKRYSVLRALRAMDAQRELTGVELEVQREMEKAIGRSAKPGGILVPTCLSTRGMTTASNGGQYLVGTEVRGGDFIEYLRDNLSIVKLGARVMTGLHGNVTIPKQSTAATANWLADETAAITESNQSFGQVSISPKNCAALTQVSRQLMMQSNPSVENLVMRDLAQVVALAIDTAAIRGSAGNRAKTSEK